MKNIITQILHYIGSQAIDFSEFLTKFFVIICLFLTPIKGFAVVLIAFIMADTVVGIYTSIKLSDKKIAEEIQSHKLFNVGVKLIVYLGSIALIYLIDHFVFEDNLFQVQLLLTKCLTFYWAHNEAKSMDEKSVKLGNRPFAVILKDLFTKAKEFKKDLNELKE